MHTTRTLRNDFFDYYKKNDHIFLKPSKVYNDDKSLFFVNAGMNQLKNIFTGKEDIPTNTKLFNSQLCIRAGGKHNDFEDVGKDSYHLTSFEMLGNWSLNNYDKKTSIILAYNFLVDYCKLNKENIYVTYFEGSSEAGIEEDKETYGIWKDIVPENRIVKGNFKDNFWMMAEDGPCGSSTEIHYDIVGNRDASSLVNMDDPMVIEIWNLVFVDHICSINNKIKQFNKIDKLFVDTGMGLERLAMIKQDKKSIYSLKCFQTLMSYIQILTNCDPYIDLYDDNNLYESYRIVSDHFRTCVISLAQGVKFGAHKRGNILQKLFRRLLRKIYLYMMDYNIKCVTDRPIMTNLIDHIIEYYKQNIDANDILCTDTILVLMKENEKSYINKIKRCGNLINKYDKKKIMDTYGIDEEIVCNWDKIKIQ